MQRTKFAHVETMPDGNSLVFSTKTCAITMLNRKDRAYFDTHGYQAISPNALRSLVKSGVLTGASLGAQGQDQSAHLDATVFTTLQCNAACIYCFEKGVKKEGRIAPEVLGAIKQKVIDEEPESLSICFHGGEPLLVPEAIEELSLFADDHVPSTHKTIVTNGTLLTSKNVELLDQAGINRVLITIDGDKESHDSVRALKSGKSSFDAIMSGLKRVMNGDGRVTVDVAVNLTPAFPDMIERLVDVLQPYRPVVSHIIPSCVTDYDHGLEMETYSSEEWAITQCEALFYILDSGFNSLSPLSTQVCSRVHGRSFVYSPTGLSHGCIAYIGRELDTQRFDQDLQHEDCKFYHLCHGGCPASASTACMSQYYDLTLRTYLPMLYERIRRKRITLAGDSLLAL